MKGGTDQFTLPDVSPISSNHRFTVEKLNNSNMELYNSSWLSTQFYVRVYGTRSVLMRTQLFKSLLGVSKLNAGF